MDQDFNVYDLPNFVPLNGLATLLIDELLETEFCKNRFYNTRTRLNQEFG